MEITTQIQSFEDKHGQASGKPYTQFTLIDGSTMNCFDTNLIATLKQTAGQVNLAYTQKDQYRNITGLGSGKTIGGNTLAPVQAVSQERFTIPEAKGYANGFREQQEKSKQAGVSMRYAVDLCIAGKIELEDVKTSALLLLESMQELSK